jgi:four helix bundle protein
MSITRFEDIIAWQKSKELVLLVYATFKTTKDFSFKNQIERASISVMNNIAEGFERQTNKEFKNFLYTAKGSCGEVRSMLSIAKELKYITHEEFLTLERFSIDISKIISGLIKTL